MFNELTRGDLLKVEKIIDNKIFCENISIKENFKNNIIDTKLVINKLDILRGDYKLVQRGKSKIINLLKD